MDDANPDVTDATEPGDELDATAKRRSVARIAVSLASGALIAAIVAILVVQLLPGRFGLQFARAPETGLVGTVRPYAEADEVITGSFAPSAQDDVPERFRGVIDYGTYLNTTVTGFVMAYDPQTILCITFTNAADEVGGTCTIIGESDVNVTIDLVRPEYTTDGPSTFLPPGMRQEIGEDLVRFEIVDPLHIRVYRMPAQFD